jgi:competence protein ComEC
LLFLVFGIWRHQIFLAKIENSPIKNFSEKEITLIGLVDKEPDVREKSIKLETIVKEIIDETTTHPPPSQPSAGPLISRQIEGRILVTTRKYPKYQYGDKLKIVGKLEEPQTFEEREEDKSSSSPFAIAQEFNYKDYLLKDGILAVMGFPEIELIGENFGNPIMKSLLSLKNKLKESLNSVMSPPQSALLEALFFGDEENMPKSWKEKFNLTGTRHITAVSGMNITIISALILDCLLFLGLWRQQAFYFSIILISFYILMIGAPASAIRAGIMGILFLTAQHFGRLSTGSRAIVFAATLMLFLNPLLLKLDIGFQLSFLAILGLIYLQPIFLDFFKKIPQFFQLRYTLAATLAAQFFTFPILIYNFGQMSLMSPLVNIFIVPLLPAITILGFIFSFLGIIFQSIGQILSWPAWLLLTYILKIINFSSKIPFSFLTLKNISWIWLLISYLILGLITWRLQERQKLKFLKY